MKCDICHKNEATIHIQEILNGKKKNLNICAQCASEKDVANADIDGFNLSEILYNISSQMMNANEGDLEPPPAITNMPPASQQLVVCKKCGWDTSRFRETGRLGCAHCYFSFKHILRNAISNMHKGKVHIGKQPNVIKGSSAELAMTLMSLQKELEIHVEREEYEEAARLRDRINKMKHNSDKKKRTRKRTG